MAQVLDLANVPDKVLVRALRSRGYTVRERIIDQMVRINPDDLARIKGDQTWGQLVGQHYLEVVRRSDLEVVHKLATTPGGKPTKVALTAGHAKMILDLQSRWGTNLSETIRAFMYIVGEIQSKSPADDK